MCTLWEYIPFTRLKEWKEIYIATLIKTDSVLPPERVQVLSSEGNFFTVCGPWENSQIQEWGRQPGRHSTSFTPGHFFRVRKQAQNSSSHEFLSPCQHFSAKLGKISILEETRRRPFLSLQGTPCKIRTPTEILREKVYSMELYFLCYFFVELMNIQLYLI